ncbi:MAG: DMT family transporter [Verrucomicrobiales bacterium]|nr:DMT family transporter [Verrucomicrobiales bacterium]
MLPALLATLLFAGSVTAAGRTTRAMGSDRANLWRILVATAVLGCWAFALGSGTGGGAFGWFFLSGVVGFGLGDLALYHSFPRIGPRLGALMVNCLAAPFAAAIEWLWLGTTLSLLQALCSAVILGGVGLSLFPDRPSAVPTRQRWLGIVFGVIAGFGQGYGAVLSRRAFEAVAVGGVDVDGGSAAFQRLLGGLCFVLLRTAWLVWVARLSRNSRGNAAVFTLPPRGIWPMVLTNALAGPAIGVACFQWALKTTPAGIVLPIVATTPLVVIPFTWVFDGDRPGWRAILGGVLAVLGVIGLTMV